MQSFVEQHLGLGEEDQKIFGVIGTVGILIGFLLGKIRRRWYVSQPSPASDSRSSYCGSLADTAGQLCRREPAVAAAENGAAVLLLLFFAGSRQSKHMTCFFLCAVLSATRLTAEAAENPAEAYKKKIRSQGFVLFTGLIMGYYCLQFFAKTLVDGRLTPHRISPAAREVANL